MRKATKDILVVLLILICMDLLFFWAWSIRYA